MWVLGIEDRASCFQGKNLSNGLSPSFELFYKPVWDAFLHQLYICVDWLVNFRQCFWGTAGWPCLGINSSIGRLVFGQMLQAWGLGLTVKLVSCCRTQHFSLPILSSLLLPTKVMGSAITTNIISLRLLLCPRLARWHLCFTVLSHQLSIIERVWPDGTGS